MTGETSLINKSQKLYFISIILVLLFCAPLFFLVMKHFYTEDVDTLIRLRSNEFIDKYLPNVTVDKIKDWNNYNDDMQILPFSDSYPLGKIVQHSYQDEEGNNIDYRILYRKIEIEGSYYILMLRVSIMENKDMIFTLLSQYSLLIIILVISLVIIQRFMLRKMWNPFYDSLSQIEGFTLEKGVIPDFKKTNIKEFNRLNNNVVSLMENDLKVYKQQKEFIENASHELQTPLAVFHSKLDILLQEPGLTKSQTEIIESLYDVTSRLTGLTKNLLLLAKIDNNQFKDMEMIDFVQSLDAYISYLEGAAASDGVKLNVEIDNPLILMANKILMGSLITNLVVNAIRHNFKNGFVNILVKDRMFVVSNTGETKPLEEEKLFKRFSRRDERKMGSGLGLCIVYQICKFHGWDIDYFYKDGLHYFTVSF